MVVVGKTGSGKSYFLKNKLLPAIQNKKNLIIVDNVTSEWGSVGLRTFGNVNELLRSGIDFIKNNSYRISIRNRTDEDIDKTAEIIMLSGNNYFFWEEAAADLDKLNTNQLKRLAYSCRHKNVGGALITQKPRTLPTSMLSQKYDIFIFSVEDFYDLIELTKQYKSKVDQIREIVENLPQYHCLWLQNGNIVGVVTA